MNGYGLAYRWTMCQPNFTAAKFVAISIFMSKKRPLAGCQDTAALVGACQPASEAPSQGDHRCCERVVSRCNLVLGAWQLLVRCLMNVRCLLAGRCSLMVARLQLDSSHSLLLAARVLLLVTTLLIDCCNCICFFSQCQLLLGVCQMLVVDHSFMRSHCQDVDLALAVDRLSLPAGWSSVPASCSLLIAHSCAIDRSLWVSRCQAARRMLLDVVVQHTQFSDL